MFKYLLFFVLVSVAFAHFTYLSDDEEFERFKKKYNRHYSSPLEEQLRKQIFTNRLHKIKELKNKYKNGYVSWYDKMVGINKFYDRTNEELHRILGVKKLSHLIKFL
ncbi:unnamed protein product [Diabrotica balteata]|uniref:Cathepsin propeptide inhibitor domain-containing protein n=1 Tax=Diabrotica balteata TaxID=107213 RepID=A0A9N9TEZ9_DIABA|nr:unnamed protein product [Diabrotica balteata]